MTRNARLIFRSVWLEFVRGKGLHLALMLMGLFALGAGVAVMFGVETAAAADFLLGLGMALAYWLSAALAVALACRQWPGEVERRTLYPLLARPVTRAEVLIGKFCAVCAIAVATLLVLFVIAWAPLPANDDLSAGALAQTVALQSLSLAVLVSLTMALSLHFPPVISAALALGAFFFGGTALNWAAAALGRVVEHGEAFVQTALFFVPDFPAFDHAQRFIGGQPAMSAGAFLALAAYGAGLALYFHLFSVWSLNRRSL